MESLILAAGKGERMFPLTKDVPKCLVKYKDKSLLEYVMSSLSGTSINIVGGYKIKSLYGLDNLIFNENYNTTGIVESMFCFDPKEDVIVSYSDIIYSENAKNILIDSDDLITLVCDDNYLEFWNLRMENPLEDLETLQVDKEDYLTTIGDKPKSYDDIMSQYTGLFKIKKNVWDFLKKIYKNENNPNLHMTNLLNLAIKNGIKIKIKRIKKDWMEFDTVSDLSITNYLPETFFESKSISKKFH